MTEQEKQAIRERLNLISSYPWALDDTNGCIWNVNGNRLMDLDPNIDPDDAEFITFAPEDISRLLDTLDERDREVERLSQESLDLDETCINLCKENQRLRTALEEITSQRMLVGELAYLIARQSLGEEKG